MDALAAPGTRLVTLTITEAGLGVTALPRLETPLTAKDALVFRELKDPVIWREICLMTKRGRSLPPAGQQLCQQLTSHLVKGPLGRMDGVDIMGDSILHKRTESSTKG